MSKNIIKKTEGVNHFFKKLFRVSENASLWPRQNHIIEQHVQNTAAMKRERKIFKHVAYTNIVYIFCGSHN